jgi:hypothetical protein
MIFRWWIPVQVDATAPFKIDPGTSKSQRFKNTDGTECVVYIAVHETTEFVELRSPSGPTFPRGYGARILVRGLLPGVQYFPSPGRKCA